MSDYDTLRQRHLEEFMAGLPEHIQRLTWPAERLREERTARLRNLIAVAQARAPWHRERLAHIDAKTVTEDDLPAVPVMTKDDLMAHWDHIVTVDGVTLDEVETHLAAITADAYFREGYHAVASGGSSGRRGVFLYDWQSWLECYQGFVRHALRARFSDPDLAGRPLVAAMVAADKPTHFTSAMAQTFRSPMVDTHRFPVTQPLADIVAGLNHVQPDMLSGYSSMLYALAHEQEAGRLRIAPQGVTPTSEPLLPEMRARMERAWACPVGNWWGSTEGGPTGVSCDKAPGMHLPDDLLIIEPVDADGRPVAPGRRSAKVYLTNLMNRALPLLRYEVTDEVTLLDEPCPCGSTHRRVADIHGRRDDCFVYDGGIVVHPIAFRSPLGRHRDIVEYQVHQTRRGAHILVRANGAVDLDGLRGDVAHEVARVGLADPEITIRAVQEIERQAIGKLKRFVPLA